MREFETDQRAIQSLVHDFPTVSARVLSEVLAAYLRTKPNLEEAVRAAHDRIVDACAM
jgi:hypothetical protein